MSLLKKILWLFLLTLLGLQAAVCYGNAPSEMPPSQELKKVIIVPIKNEITDVQLYILRRSLKLAIKEDASAIILALDTPGGALATTLKMMEMLSNFSGDTIAFVDNEAISAGAYIAFATHKIYFTPQGIMGAAAAIESTGADIPETANLKINSYLRARIRAIAGHSRYRADVMRAMMDKDFEFAIDGLVIKPKGELLSLTASESVKEYGKPFENLLASGIADDVNGLLDHLYGAGNYQRIDFKLTWAELAAKWLAKMTPVFLGLGLMLLFIEFKTPGFGFIGIAGIALLTLVFVSTHLAGLAGYEAYLVFVLALILLSIEFFFLPGIFIAGTLGAVLLLGSFFWALSDIWPKQSINFNLDLFSEPAQTLSLGLLIAFLGFYIIGKFLVKGWFGSHLVLKQSVSKMMAKDLSMLTLKIGDLGVVTTALRPSGEIEIFGKRYQAHVKVGSIEKNMPIEVVEIKNLSILVKERH